MGSIESFKDLRQVFLTKLMPSKKQPLTDVALMTMKQGPNESMRSYAKRFSNVHSQIDSSTKKLAIKGFKVGIYDDNINLII